MNCNNDDEKQNSGVISGDTPGEKFHAILIAGRKPLNPRAMAAMMSRSFTGIEKPKVLYIGAANGDSPLFFKLMKSVLKRAGADKITFLRLAREKINIDAAKEAISDADVIFLSGGEVEDGMKWLNKHGLVDFLKDLYKSGKRFMGISAGVIMMGTHWVHWDIEGDDSTSKLFDCLGCIPVLFDVHGEDEDWTELKTALKLLGKDNRGYGLPAGSMISADSRGSIVNLEKEYLVYVNEGGSVHEL